MEFVVVNPIVLNETQVKNILHATGLDRKSKPFRNYYNSGSPSTNWEELVNFGLAVRRNTPKESGGIYYHLTLSGFAFIINNNHLFPKLDKRIKYPTTLQSMAED